MAYKAALFGTRQFLWSFVHFTRLEFAIARARKLTTNSNTSPDRSTARQKYWRHRNQPLARLRRWYFPAAWNKAANPSGLAGYEKPRKTHASRSTPVPSRPHLPMTSPGVTDSVKKPERRAPPALHQSLLGQFHDVTRGYRVGENLREPHASRSTPVPPRPIPRRHSGLQSPRKPPREAWRSAPQTEPCSEYFPSNEGELTPLAWSVPRTSSSRPWPHGPCQSATLPRPRTDISRYVTFYYVLNTY